MKRWIAAILCLSLLLAMFAGCASEEAGLESGISTSAPASQDASEAQPIDLGEILTVDIDGKEVTPEIFAGHKLTVVNVWATWCTWCLKEMPHLAEIAEEMEADGVQIVGLVTDAGTAGAVDEEQLALVKEIMEQTGVEYPIILPDASLSEILLSQVAGLPQTFFVNGEGEALPLYYPGYQDKEGWISTIQSVLATLEGES